MGPPLVSTSLVLKQLDTLSFSRIQKSALDLACPHFLERPISRAAIDALRENLYINKQNNNSVNEHIPQFALRRYTGSQYLPRGRYYTVCDPDTQDDSGTLVCELEAYLSILFSGIIEILDSCTLSKKYLRHMLANPRCILMLFFESDEMPNRFFEWLFPWNDDESSREDFIFLEDNKHKFDDTYRYICVPLKYSIIRYSAHEILDLRQPDAQEWVTGALNELIGGRLNFKSFENVLPYLLCPRRGGGQITSLIGETVRPLGCNGVVFPSARADSYCNVANGDIFNCAGWNFVDFSGLRNMDRLVGIEPEEGDLEFAENIRISVEDSGPMRGSTTIEGLSYARSARIRSEFENLKAESREKREERALDYTDSSFQITHFMRNSVARARVEKAMDEIGLKGSLEQIPIHALLDILEFMTITGEFVQRDDVEYNKIAFRP